MEDGGDSSAEVLKCFLFSRFPCATADAINNAAGFGFRGYDRNGVARWDLVSNLRIQQIEVSGFWVCTALGRRLVEGVVGRCQHRHQWWWGLLMVAL